MSTGKISSEIKEVSVKGDLGNDSAPLAFQTSEQRIVVEANALLPSSAEVRAYEELCPGAAQTILTLTVEQSNHRREMERQESERKNERRRLEAKALENAFAIQTLVVLFALLVCATLLIFAIVFLFQGKLAESGISLALPTLWLISVLVRAVFHQKPEKDEQENEISQRDAA